MQNSFDLMAISNEKLVETDVTDVSIEFEVIY
jgi:hypothetical protein